MHQFSFFLLYFTPPLSPSLFFFNDPATTEIYTLSLHDALPIYMYPSVAGAASARPGCRIRFGGRSILSLNSSPTTRIDRKSTRLNSSHANISYAVFCLKKKKQQ